MTDEKRIFCFCGRVPYAHVHKVEEGCPEPRVRFQDLPVRDISEEELDKEMKEIYGDGS